jgi:hypothetical protein
MTVNDENQLLSQIAMMSNRLGHESSGELRAWAFRTKADAVSKLIVRGGATANGIRANGEVGININGQPRLHVPRHLLKREALACVREQDMSIRVTAPLSESLDFAQLGSLSLVGRK